jgi:hypothetical protein
MSRLSHAAHVRPEPMSAAERQRRHRQRVKAAEAKRLPLLLGKRMRVSDIKRIAQHIVESTDAATARRMAREIVATLREQASQDIRAHWRNLRNDPAIAMQLLGLGAGHCTKEEVKAAYRRKTKQHHPDHDGSGDAEVLTALAAARDCLLYYSR